MTNTASMTAGSDISVEPENTRHIFKNPDEKPAWQCIEECGLRGYTVGGAKISDKHCNFIVNEGNATCEDVKKLIELVQSKVKEKFNIELKTEVEEYTWQEKKTMS